MALARWTGVVQDALGNAVPGASIEVRREETGALVPLFSDRNGLVGLGNPFTAADATFFFHAAGGSYRIRATLGPFLMEWRYVSVGTAGELDADVLLENIDASLESAIRIFEQDLTPQQQGQARANFGAGDMAGFVDLLINGMGQVSQRAYATVADDAYWCDRHYVLTQTAAITPTILADVASGLPNMMRLTQSQAAAQRMGNAQIVEASLSRAMRGRKVTLGGRLRHSIAQSLRYVVLEWTGTADAVISDVVNSWTNGTFAPGQFFNAANLVVAGSGELTPAAGTLTDFEVVADISNACNNIIVFIWTNGTVAQGVTLDMAWSLLSGDWSASAWPYVRPRHVQQEIGLCERYYQSHRVEQRFFATVAGQYGHWSSLLPTRMRANPSSAAALDGASGWEYNGVISVDDHARVDLRATGANSNAYWYGQLRLDAEL